MSELRSSRNWPKPGIERILSVLFWEFLQNLPLVAAFVLGAKWWPEQKLRAVLIFVLGSIVGSLVIYGTESKIVAGHRESPRVLLTNMVSMAVLMFLTVLYLRAPWGNWQTDLLVGVSIGVILGAAQSRAAGERLGVRHCLALACSFSLAIIGVRVFVLPLPAWGGILLLAFFVTLLIGLSDYMG